LTGINQPSSSYSPQLLSHQTGLSVTSSSANTGYNIGSAISIPRNGIVKITIAGHINGGEGFIQLNLTRGTVTYSLGGMSSVTSLLGNQNGTYIGSSTGFFTNVLSNSNPYANNSLYGSNPFTLEIPVLSGDSLQFLAGNNTAGDITYIDDMVVILQ
jgi:hypothetical protein